MARRWKLLVCSLGVLALAAGVGYWRMRHGRPELEARVGSPLIIELTEGRYFYEVGGAGALTRVVAYVPDHECQNEPIRALMTLAEKWPNDLHVELVRMHSAEGMQMLGAENKGSCAHYEINGRDAFSLSRADGSVRKGVFEASPGGTWTTEDLKSAVEQAIAEAKAGDTASGGSP